MPGPAPYKSSKQQYPQKVTAKLRAAFALGDQPTEQLGGFLGYFHQQDPTTFAKDNVLTYPSINCFIPFKDKIVPRLGTTILGSPYTGEFGAVGHMKKYGTTSGIELELRVNKSDGARGDIIYAFCPDFIAGVQQTTYTWRQITLNTNPLPVGAHEYYFDQWYDADLDPAQSLNLSRAIWVNGTTNIYSWSGGIAPIVSIVPNTSITTIPGKTWSSLGFIDPAFDSTLNGTITINGVAYTITGGWETDTLTLTTTIGINIDDITFSQIQETKTPVNITGTITHGAVTEPPSSGLPFQKGELVVGSVSGAMGFITIDGAGPGPMLLYGITPGPSGSFFQAGETITGISSKAYTIVSTYTQTSTNQLVFDVCRNNFGYMYYGAWNSMKVYQSNQFAKDATEYITNVQAVQNDLVLGTTPYTGFGQNVYRVSIDLVFPEDNTQTYIPTGTSTGLNDGSFSTIGYTGAPNYTKPNVYRMNILADATVILNGTLADFLPGQTIKGANSNAEAAIVTKSTTIVAGKTVLGVRMITGNMFNGSSGETIAESDDPTITATSFQALFQNWAQYVDNNNTVQLINTGSGPLAISPINIVSPITLTDGLTFKFSNFYGHSVGDSFQLSINQGGHDTYKWQINGATPVATGVPIPPGIGTLVHGAVVGGPFQVNERVVGATSGAFAFVTSDIAGTMTLYNPNGIFTTGETITGQTSGATTTVISYTITGVTQFLSNGVSISFILNTGHTLGDFWDITCTQSVGGNKPTDQNPQAFANFYYTVPNRIPGEGYIYQLSANFWAMAPQETYMYVCDNYGQWSYITASTKAASATNTFETIAITPLKQTSSSKPIFPYMISYLENDIIFVTTEKTLDLIGRKQLIQLPHMDSLSHPVQLDFYSVSFKGGSMEYWNNRLWINSPTEGVMFCYDNQPENKYWQPPQLIPENGILSIFNRTGTDVLISHSSIRNQSWTLFDGQNGDNGFEYLVQARTPYLSKGNRWQSKSANMTFSEGYVTGKPPMVQTLYKEVNGCGGIISHDIVPVVCVGPSNAPFGMGHFGAHPNGSDVFIQQNYFREIFPYQQTQNFYFAAIQMSCLTTNHTYEWLTFGINSVSGARGNIDFKNQTEILAD